MTPNSGATLARGRCDSEQRLIETDDLLLALQMRCGGEVPGPIAIPALREAVARAMASGLATAAPVSAHDGAEIVTAWVELSPAEDGCRIAVRQWATRPAPADDERVSARRRALLARQTAEFSARLDARQCALVAE